MTVEEIVKAVESLPTDKDALDTLIGDIRAAYDEIVKAAGDDPTDEQVAQIDVIPFTLARKRESIERPRTLSDKQVRYIELLIKNSRKPRISRSHHRCNASFLVPQIDFRALTGQSDNPARFRKEPVFPPLFCRPPSHSGCRNPGSRFNSIGRIAEFSMIEQKLRAMIINPIVIR